MYPFRPLPLNLLGLGLGLIAVAAFAIDFAARGRVDWLSYPGTIMAVAATLIVLLFAAWRTDVFRARSRRRIKRGGE